MLVAMTPINYMLFVFTCRLRYGHGHVRDISELKSFEVQFEDGTICSDMAREDIIVSCVRKALCCYCYSCVLAGSCSCCVCCINAHRERERER